MDHSTLIVLVFLTIGQILMMAFGVLILWLAGEFGDAPKVFNNRRRADQAGETTIAMRGEASEQSDENSNGLMALADEHSIQPRAAEDQINPLEDGVEHSRDRAVSAEKL